MTEDDRAAARQLVLRHGWNAVAYQIAHGRRFYNFRGLEAFKASLEPMRWEPVYAIAPAGRITPWMLR